MGSMLDLSAPERSPASAPVERERAERNASAILAKPKALPTREPDAATVFKAPTIRKDRRKTEFRPAEVMSEVGTSRDPASEPTFSVDRPGGFKPHSEISFCPEFSFLRIDGQGSGGASAKLLSNMNYGGDLSWRQRWTERSSSYLTAGFSRVDFQGAPGGKVISQSGKTFGGFGAGADYSPGDRWKVGLGVSLKQEIFYEHTSPTGIRVDQVMVPRVNISVRYDLFKLNPFGMGMGLRSAYLFPSSANGYEVKSGSSHRFSFFVKENENSGRLRPAGEIFYDWTKQDSSLHSKSAKELGVQIGLTWIFGQ